MRAPYNDVARASASVEEDWSYLVPRESVPDELIVKVFTMRRGCRVGDHIEKYGAAGGTLKRATLRVKQTL